MLLRRRPETRVLILEASAEFRPTSTATSELAGLFLTQGLCLWDHLASHELTHHGSRFWFHDDEVTRIQTATEFGTRVQPPLPSFILREDVTGQHLLDEAERSGCVVKRPVRVTRLQPGKYDSTIYFTTDGSDGSDGGEATEEEVQATWVLDASGREAIVGRSLSLVHPRQDHPVAAITGRWRGDLDLDGVQMHTDETFSHQVFISRRLSSNHFQGYGYRIHCLALSDREISLSVVYDKRILDLHLAENIGDAYTGFLSGLPATRQLLSRATLIKEDLRVLPQVSFFADEGIGEGWALLGTSGGYDDPLGAPHMDSAGRSTETAVDFICRQLDGTAIGAELSRHNALLNTSHKRNYAARIRGSYQLGGDFDLFWPLYLLDRGLYMLSEVLPIATSYRSEIRRLPWTGVLGGIAATTLRFFRWRFRRMVRNRLRSGHYGRNNHGLRLYYRLDTGPSAIVALVHGLTGWLLREFENIGSLIVLPFSGGPESDELGAELSTLPQGVDILSD